MSIHPRISEVSASEAQVVAKPNGVFCRGERRNPQKKVGGEGLREHRVHRGVKEAFQRHESLFLNCSTKRPEGYLEVSKLSSRSIFKEERVEGRADLDNCKIHPVLRSTRNALVGGIAGPEVLALQCPYL